MKIWLIELIERIQMVEQIDLTTASSLEDLKNVKDLIFRQMGVEQAIEDIEINLRFYKDQHRKLSEELIPNAFDSLGIAKLTLDDGRTIEVKDVFTASIAKRKWPFVEKKLAELKSTDIINKDFLVPFSDSVLEVLLDNSVSYELKQNINTNTLKAFVKEQMGAGKLNSEDMENFGVFQIRKSIIK